MCLDARYLIQYIHFSFDRFCDDESSRDFATVFNYRPATWLYYVAGSGSGVKLLPPVMAAHAGNIESIVAQITPTMCLLRLKKTLIACPLSYTAVYYDARFQTNSYNCLSYYTNNRANNGFATFSKTGIITYNMSNILCIIYDAHFGNNHAV